MGAAKLGCDKDNGRTRAAEDGRNGNTKGVSKVKASVEGELGSGLKSCSLGFVFLGLDLDGGSGGRDEFGINVVLTVERGLETAIVEQIDGLRHITIGQVHIGTQGA